MIALFSFVLLSATAFGQGGSVSLSGTVQDASGGVLVGANLKARNVDTGVESRTTSNDRGIYNFPSIQAGNYEITAEASGFSRDIRAVRLSAGAQSTLNFNLAVMGTVTEVAVTGAVESVVLEAGSSTGTFLQEDLLQTIPMVGNNIMQILNVFGGVSEVTDPVFGAQSQEFAGVRANMINVTRDGLTVTEVRQPSGIQSNANINSEMIGEFKMVLSAVDAEMGRGTGQVQMTTRSGSNAFHGSGVWNIQNTGLDARDFSAKRNNTPASWRNLNNYLVTVSGPVIRNKTFFFATWEQQISRNRELTTVKVLTPCARKGIYRYIANATGHPSFPQGVATGLIPAARNANNTMNILSGTAPSVDENGRPLESGSFYNSSDTSQVINLSGQLQIRSVFGDWAPGVREAFLADKGDHGVYGDCENIPFNATLNGGTDTRNYYGNNTLVGGSYWGGDFASGGIYRHAYDPTGFVQRFTFGTSYKSGTVVMPPPNFYYNTGDGLNYAGHSYYNPLIGAGGSIYGSGGDPDRKSITVKIDHNINSNHRLSGTYTQEAFFVGDYHGLSSTGTWPEAYGGYTGDVTRNPKSFAVSLTSTLRPTLLNEARFGFALSEAWQHGPQFAEKTKDNMMSVLENLMPPSATLGRQLIIGVGEGATLYHVDPLSAGASHPLGGREAMPLIWGGPDGRWTGADTVTWMVGAHAFKSGAEYRWNRSRQDYNGMRGFAGSGAYIETPVIFGGLTGSTSTGGAMRRNTVLGRTMNWNDVYLPGVISVPSTGGGNYTLPRQMMTYFSGAINTTRQYFYQQQDGNSVRWNDVMKGENLYSMDLASTELGFFFKDDWKVRSDLTLNLGVRWEYYGAPYERNGYTIRVLGDALQNAFGISTGNGFENWMKDRKYVEAPSASIQTIPHPLTGIPVNQVVVNGNPPAPVTEYAYVGSGSKHPDLRAWNKDMNNFAPHLGFSWQLPWLGKGLTTLRGGWSIGYAPMDNFNQYGVYIADVSAAGTSRQETFAGIGDGQGDMDSTMYYMDLTDLNVAGKILNNNGLLNPNTEILPLVPNRVGQMDGSGYVIDANTRNPYTHSFNMSLTRNIGRNLTFDVRYIGSLGREQTGALLYTNVNQSNYIDNGLYIELEKIRRNNGYQSPLLNSLVQPGSLVAGSTTTGTDQMRTYGSAVANNLATGNFSGVVSTLSTSNGTFYVPTTSTRGLLSRIGCLPQDRPNGNIQTPADYVNNGCTKGTPWNYFYANPQYSSLSVYYNAPLTNYHSMQAQVTMRPTRGLNFQATYTWSRNLSNSGWTDFTADYRDGRDYTLASQHRSHSLNTYGGWELPFGANGLFFRSAQGAFKKAIEGWQLSWITVMASGAPASVTGQSTLWSRSWPQLVRPDLWDDKGGHMVWSDNFADGYYFGRRYMKYRDYGICDPDNLTPGLARYCTVDSSQALALASGQYDAKGNMLVARYNSLAEALKYDPYAKMEVIDGQEVMPAIMIFRSVDQSQGGKAMGNYKSNRITGLGRLTLDMSMSKSVEFMEGKRFEVRVDAQNIMNHATPTAPSYGITGTGAFGRSTNKTGHRTFQARLRLSF